MLQNKKAQIHGDADLFGSISLIMLQIVKEAL